MLNKVVPLLVCECECVCVICDWRETNNYETSGHWFIEWLKWCHLEKNLYCFIAVVPEFKSALRSWKRFSFFFCLFKFKILIVKIILRSECFFFVCTHSYSYIVFFLYLCIYLYVVFIFINFCLFFYFSKMSIRFSRL